jgi:hypothetical protein
MLIVYGVGWLASLAGVLGVEGLRLNAEAGVPSWVDRLGWLFTAWLAAPLLLAISPILLWRRKTRRTLA